MAVPTAITDLSTTAASNSPTGNESIGTNLDDYLRTGFAFDRQIYNGAVAAAAASVASASTTNIGAAASPTVTVTGTTTITAFDSVADGIKRDVTFSGALTLTHNATSLILPGAANITTTAGDCATFLSLGSGNWRCIKYQYSAAAAARTALGAAADSAVVHLAGTETISGSKTFSGAILSSQTQGNYIIQFPAGTGGIIQVNQASFSSGTASMCYIGRDSSTLRSINAGGTVNASGADYAEYMRKAAGCDLIAKGAIVGVNADGELTTKWADSVSFMVKSTNPSYVGGDTWGSDESLGMARPSKPERNEGESEQDFAVREAEFASATAIFMARAEAERVKYDRIAFAGQVPVNVFGAHPGDYIIPAQDGEFINGIAAPKNAITFEQYKNAVGIVQNILPDGRANVRVKAA